MRSRSVAVVLAVSGVVGACESTRDRAEIPRYEDDVQGLLAARCLRCHADPAPAGGWSATTYTTAIGCGSDRVPAALDRPDHAGLVTAAERARLAEWLTAGAPHGRPGVHAAGFGNPRVAGAHGAFLRERGYRPMRDANDADACGTCHDGAARPAKVSHGAPDAPACATCHAVAEGPLACGTCHGDGARASPPRNTCFHPDAAPDAHAAHVSSLACTTCHPTPAAGAFDGAHANGMVDVRLDPGVAGRRASYDPAAKRCSGTCHARGGARPEPAWSDRNMTCNDCHASPPKGHYAGACTSCHAEANADGTALSTRVLHVNGKVDLGNGNGTCGACHGSGDNPWPRTGAHAAHAQPRDGKPVPCETCHEVPSLGTRHPLGGAAAVRLSGLAVRGGRRATFDAATKTCAGTYCHEGIGAATPAPRWSDAPATCSSCHAAPPPPPHTQRTTCGDSGCHQNRASAAHVDGIINLGPP